jgi:tRNA (guanine-N(7)-)-methyltransferase subunit TRM82
VPSQLLSTAAGKRDGLVSHENPSGGQLILGHTSLLTSFSLSSDERFIITADRDEHIRISWYPQGYCIEGYCLSHNKYMFDFVFQKTTLTSSDLRRFVSAIHIPAFAPSTLISGGGDPAIKIWKWMTGSLLFEVPISDAVYPFIKVRPKKRKWGEDHDDSEEVCQHKKLHGRKGRGKIRAGRVSEDREVVVPEEVQDVENDAAMDDEDTSALQESTSEVLPDPVLVIHKIETMVVSDHRSMVFSAVG